MAQSTVQLQRHNKGIPWGFRLQGGRDFSSQLSVKKVQAGTPADGHLRSGDNILAIGNRNTQGMTHMQANGLIKGADNVIQFTISRGPVLDFASIKPSGPVKFSPWKHNNSAPTASYLK